MINYDHGKAIISVKQSTLRGSISKTLVATDSGYKIKIQYYESYPFTSEWTENVDPEDAISSLVEWGNLIYRHRGSLHSPLSHIVDKLETTGLSTIGCYTCGL